MNRRHFKRKSILKIQLYKDKAWIEKFFNRSTKYDYEGTNEPVKKFSGTHPLVMQTRIARKNWPFQPDLSVRFYNAKDMVKRTIGKITGWYPGEYKNYKII